MSKDTLLHISGNSYVWSGKYAVGVYLHAETQEAYLFDSGPNTRTAEMIDCEVTSKGYRIAGIIHTHGHLVNTGGSYYFRKQYPTLKCYASHLSAAYINNPSLLEPLDTVSHIHNPITELSNPSSSCMITDMIPFNDGVFDINGIPFTFYTLSGHFPGMVGIQTPDQVLYCADALFGSETLSRQKLLVFMEPKEAKQSLEKLKTIQASAYVVYHGGIYNSISNLIEENIKRLDDAYDDFWNLIKKQWQTPESITQQIMTKYDFKNNVKQYELAQSLTLSYLKQLLIDDKISRIIKNGILFYKMNDAIS